MAQRRGKNRRRPPHAARVRNKKPKSRPEQVPPVWSSPKPERFPSYGIGTTVRITERGQQACGIEGLHDHEGNKIDEINSVFGRVVGADCFFINLIGVAQWTAFVASKSPVVEIFTPFLLFPGYRIGQLVISTEKNGELGYSSDVILPEEWVARVHSDIIL